MLNIHHPLHARHDTSKGLTRFLLVTALTILAIGTIKTVYAQNTSSKDPIEILADATLEWHRNDLKFIATKNASATQGDVSIHAQTLTADYHDDAGKKFDIWRVRADQDVQLKSKDTTAYGDKADYDIAKGYAEMTGNDLKMVAPDQTLTARDKFEYWVTDGKMIATGDATIVRKNEKGEINTLKADQIVAYLKTDANGKRVLDRMEAHNNVIITTPTEVLTGNQGTYNAGTNMAEINGNVKIQRGPNTLEGAKADLNLTTNISRMFGGSGSRGRVRGVFYPGSEEKPGQ